MGVMNQVAVALAGYSALVAAVPLEARTPTTSFTLNQVASHKKPFVSGAQIYQKALRKYGAAVPHHVASAASAAVSGSATTTPESGDVEYLTPVTIGKSTLNLDFDTGSADLWVFSSELPSKEQTGHSIYNTKSSGKKLSGATWQISYGDGSGANGDVYTDTVSVGGVTATSQAVEAAQSISAQFQQDTDNDGLLGLAFSSINTVSPKPQTTFFDTVKSSLDKPLFAVTLKHQAPGSYDFGFIDVQKYTGQIAYTPVDSSQGFWSFTASGYSVGGGNSSAKFTGGRHIAPRASIDGIADTGTTLLLLPDNIVDDYYGHVSGAKNDASAGGYTFPCDASLPDLTFTIDSYDAVVPGALINLQQQGSSCFGGLQSSSGIGINIFGDVFLKSQYVVFDSEGPQIGFAPQA